MQAEEKNIGKKCKILDSFCDLYEGDIYEIKDILRNGENRYWIWNKNKTNYHSRNTDQIEILEDEENREGNKYRCTLITGGFEKDDLVTMIEDDNTSSCRYERDGDGFKHYANNDCFELIKDNPKKEFCVGDRVICVDDNMSKELVIGKEYIVSESEKGEDRIRIIDGNGMYYPKRFKLSERENEITLGMNSADGSNLYATRTGTIQVKVGDTVESLINGIGVKKGFCYQVVSISSNTLLVEVPLNKGVIKEKLIFDEIKLINSIGSNGDSQSTKVGENNQMDMLKKIPSTLKRILDKDLQSMYKVGFINGDLALTEKGEREVLNYLITVTATKKAISDIAKEMIAEAKTDK